MHDLRYALRTLRNSPGFTLAVTILLALGIGANCVIFSALDAVMLRRLPVRHPEQLYRVVTNLPQIGKRSYMPPAMYKVLRDRASSGQGVATDVLGFQEEFAGVTEPGPAEQIRVHLVTPDYFGALGAGTVIGRVLGPGDVDTAVLSYGFFEQRFNADPRAIGRSVVLHGHRFTVVGVMPREFNGISADTAPQVRVPLVALPLFEEEATSPGYDGISLDLSVRLRPGVSIPQASGEINAISHAVHATSATVDIELEPLEHGVSRLRDRFSGALLFLTCAVGLLLLIVCTNVAGLILARSASRRQDIAVRLALGATRGRLIRQMLTESLLLAALGGAGGLAIAFGATPLLQRAIPPMRDFSSETVPLVLNFHPDFRVLGFSLVLCLATAVLFGLAPALQISQASRTGVHDVLRSSRSTSSWRTRQALMAFEVALCTVLLAGAGLLVRTFEQLQHLDAGFDRDRVVTFTLNPCLIGYSPQQADSVTKAWIEKVRALPGVTSVAVASLGVMRGSGLKMTMGVAGRRIAPADFLNVSSNRVSREYFETMGIHIIAGRGFVEADRPPDNFSAVPVDQRRPSPVIVNETFAKRFFPGEDPIGRLVGPASNGVALSGIQIVGVVSDAKYRSLREPVPSTMYGFASQPTDNRFILHVRTANRPEAIIRATRDELRAIDPQLPIIEIHTLAEEVSASLWSERLVATLATIFGALAALLTAVGLFGLLAYAVTQRSKEIGIRMALGAGPRDIGAAIGGQALAIVFGGLLVGVAGTLFVAPAIRSLLYGIPPNDALTLFMTVAFILLIGVIATAVPIVRAIGVNPAVTLQHE